MTRGNTWTAQEDVQLLTMYIDGVKTEDIATAIGRSTHAVENRMGVLRHQKGVQVPRKKWARKDGENYTKPAPVHVQRKRPCLCCNKSFVSSGPGNRMCSECRRLSVSPYAI